MFISKERKSISYDDRLKDVAEGGTFFVMYDEDPYMLLGGLPIGGAHCANIRTGAVTPIGLETLVCIRAFEAAEKEW
jgi:hypothetical protein